MRKQDCFLAAQLSLMILVLSVQSATAQTSTTTTITDVSFVRTALYDIDTRTTIPPLILNATVSYSGAKTGYFLGVGVFDLDSGDLVNGLGSSMPQSCVTTSQFAGCIVPISSNDGSERMQFLLNNPQSVWNLALVAALLDELKNPISSSFSDYILTITVYSAPTLTINVPNSVNVDVDGTNGSGGSVQLVLRAGNHAVSVPEIVEVNNTTRLRFSGWSDGVTEANRTVALNWDVTLRADYAIQYKLQVTSAVTIRGGGWYDSGTTVHLSSASGTVPMNGLLGAIGAKWILRGWVEDGARVSNSTSATISMNSPHEVIVIWQADYTWPLFLGAVVALAAVSSALYYKKRSRTKRTQTRRHQGRRTRGNRKFPFSLRS